jgi:hypothetical protein
MTATASAVLRRVNYPGKPEMTELAGDVQQALTALVRVQLHEFTEVYAEPMDVAITPTPRYVLALDVREDAFPETGLIGTARMDYVRTATGIPSAFATRHGALADFAPPSIASRRSSGNGGARGFAERRSGA